MKRLRYLDGVRGLASLQVVLGHYSGAFLPVMAGEGYLRYPTEAFSAVYLFFLMSGMVLTYSFERTPFAFGLGLRRRVIRLGMPLSMAALFSGALITMAPNLGTMAATLAHSNWVKGMNGIYAGPRDFLHVAADATGLTTLFGYSDTSIFGFLRPLLPSITDSTDQPLWSLHIELWGSFLVLALVYACACSAWIYWGLLVACSVLIGAHPLGLFIFGHLAARVAAQPWFEPLVRRRLVSAVGIGMIFLGITVCTHIGLPATYGLERLLMLGSIVPVHTFFTWYDELGAALIFPGVLLTFPLCRVLCARPVLLLGRLSFPIYLLHWPVMLTLGAAVFTMSLPYLGQTPAAFLALVLGLTATLGFAEFFERYVDAPAVALSRRLRMKISDPSLAPVMVSDQEAG